jgi:hypothetical protein
MHWQEAGRAIWMLAAIAVLVLLLALVAPDWR